ncbi:hypothetical protein [Ruminococcus sp.]|uniref:hypothetical protein n=1 Tax=Ruminococcus sp. TaxID=41978 RepID=UPI00388FBEC8
MIIKSDDTIIDGNNVKDVEKSHLLKNAEGISERTKSNSLPICYYRIEDLFDIESVFERIKSLVEILADYYIHHPVGDLVAREKADDLLVSLVDIMNIVCQEVQDLERKIVP